MHLLSLPDDVLYLIFSNLSSIETKLMLGIGVKNRRLYNAMKDSRSWNDFRRVNLGADGVLRRLANITPLMKYTSIKNIEITVLDRKIDVPVFQLMKCIQNSNPLRWNVKKLKLHFDNACIQDKYMEHLLISVLVKVNPCVEQISININESEFLPDDESLQTLIGRYLRQPGSLPSLKKLKYNLCLCPLSNYFIHSLAKTNISHLSLGNMANPQSIRPFVGVIRQLQHFTLEDPSSFGYYGIIGNCDLNSFINMKSVNFETPRFQIFECFCKFVNQLPNIEYARVVGNLRLEKTSIRDVVQLTMTTIQNAVQQNRKCQIQLTFGRYPNYKPNLRNFIENAFSDRSNSVINDVCNTKYYFSNDCFVGLCFV